MNHTVGQGVAFSVAMDLRYGRNPVGFLWSRW
jgi:hypothetical protein